MGETIERPRLDERGDEEARRSRSSRRSTRRSATPTSGRTTARSRSPRRRTGTTSSRARKFNVEDDLATIGKPVDRGRWGMTPPTSDAYYNPLLNEIVFPAGILQPPAFSLDAIDAVNYGAIGVVIGHEISHGFDDEGAQYDAQGRLENWWTAEDLKKFQAKTACVVDQFDGYFVEPGIHHNGKLVLGESIGDLGGREDRLPRVPDRAARQAAAARRSTASRPTSSSSSPGASSAATPIRPEFARTMVQGDPHPIAKYRVIGPLSNLPGVRRRRSRASRTRRWCARRASAARSGSRRRTVAACLRDTADRAAPAGPVVGVGPRRRPHDRRRHLPDARRADRRARLARADARPLARLRRARPRGGADVRRARLALSRGPGGTLRLPAGGLGPPGRVSLRLAEPSHHGSRA